jgi:hypothetical protein
MDLVLQRALQDLKVGHVTVTHDISGQVGTFRLFNHIYLEVGKLELCPEGWGSAYLPLQQRRP